ncbi:MAG: protein tyrosine phosphatase family protein [Chloroflexi bacterium]|nr:protein tyrosine phosphatase family protein [Chloroflexota bacterium]
MYNFYRLDDRVACAGQPQADDFARIKEAGYEVVFNLAPADSSHALHDEQAVVAGQGLAYVHIPVIWDAPQRRDFALFCQAMQAHDGRNLFIHCIANMRVSAFLYLYQRTQGVPEKTARQVLDAIWQPNPTWQAFINHVLAEV